MEILQTDNGAKGEFYIEIEGKIVAQMSYVWAGEDKIIIDHTEVDNSLKGKGAGKQMLLKTVEFARSKGIRILPLCPFAKAMIDRSKELQDIL
ncbi:MAG: GNAT family N-acetyltransferase [Balneolaceae bacterium]